jgi:hypothetical protein
MFRLRALTAAASLSLLGGCVHPRAPEPPQQPAIAAAEIAPPSQPDNTMPGGPPASESPYSAIGASPPSPPPQPAPAEAAAPPPAPVAPAAPVAAPAKAPKAAASKTANKPASVASKPPALPAAPTAAPSTMSAPPVAAAAAQASLDLTSLEQRLRDTKAIGVFTKLSLKNQVDDLLAQFKSFHQGQSESTLAQLREKYELLLLKVISLLQDGDPPLAAAVSSSREAIWGILADPRKFAQI